MHVLLERINLRKLRAVRKTEALFKRTGVIIVCLPLLAAFIVHQGIIAFTALTAFVAVLGVRELHNMSVSGARNRRLRRVSELFIAAALLPLAILYRETAASVIPDCFCLIAASTLVFTSIVQVLKNPSRNLHSITLTFLGLLYVSWFLSHLIMLRTLSPYFVLSVLFITWMSDAAAYLFGSLYGKHKLVPGISPQKTIEGAVGAVACSLIAVFIASSVFLEGLISLTVTDCVILGLVLGGTSILGDIIESAIKRRFHVKHSGRLVPGHGGVLDVIDSILFTAPAMYYYLRIFKLL